MFSALIRTYPPEVGWNCHCCAVPLLQACCWTAVPLAVAAARASTHFELFLLTTVFQPVGEIAALASSDTLMVNAVATTAATRAAAIAINRRRVGVPSAGVGVGRLLESSDSPLKLCKGAECAFSLRP